MRVYLKGAVACGAFAVAITELLSIAHVLSRSALLTAWTLAAACALAFLKKPRFSRPGLIDSLLIALVGAILAVLAFVALKSAPNSTDAMAYHLPRVLFWAQQHSVA